MNISEFDYNLPPQLIAQHPLPERDASRMMVVLRKEDRIIHSRFSEFPGYLQKGDVLILNNTKVIPAKLWGDKDGTEVEFLFLAEKEKGNWEVLCRPAKKIKAGDRIAFAADFEGTVIEAGEEGRRILKFSTADVLARLREVGFAPLPPYIKRKKANTDLRPEDLERYQTVFAEKEGAIAAPTAGLHFTPQILDLIRNKGVEIEQIALQVGLATFQPMRVEHIEDHRMLEETYSISERVAKAINSAKKRSKPIVAVGTTVVRTLESSFLLGADRESAQQEDRSASSTLGPCQKAEISKKTSGIRPGTNSTSLFIYPGFKFQVVDKLLTNFHLPRSTLLMLVSAFAERDLILHAYKEAVREKYRFFSYGDCMLIL
jgi:S-adenosylmethionine:tRNA ribosyltransferase-isomerase